MLLRLIFLGEAQPRRGLPGMCSGSAAQPCLRWERRRSHHLNRGSKVDRTDFAIAPFGKHTAQTGFGPRAEVNVDGAVDVRDAAFTKLTTGTNGPPWISDLRYLLGSVFWAAAEISWLCFCLRIIAFSLPRLRSTVTDLTRKTPSLCQVCGSSF